MAWDEAKRWLRMKLDRARSIQRKSVSLINPPVDPTSAQPYDHDAVGPGELADLLGFSEPAETKESEEEIEAPVQSEGASRLSVLAQPFESEPDEPVSETTVQVGNEAADFKSGSDADDLDLTYLGYELRGGVGAASVALEFDLPADEPVGLTPEIDDTPEISDSSRAEQLAIQFLKSVGELNPLNVARISEIILARKWSRAQVVVKELVGSGFEISHIYQAFLVSEAWRQCDAMDERLGGETLTQWYEVSRPRITWLESMRLVDFVGVDMSVAEVMEFSEIERHIWRGSARLRARYPRFKDYLFGYRIATESRQQDGGWFRTLDPRDGRFFDGTVNPEFTSDWWDDGLPSSRGREHLSRLIFKGCPLGYLVAEPGNEMDWFDGLLDD